MALSLPTKLKTMGITVLIVLGAIFFAVGIWRTFILYHC